MCALFCFDCQQSGIVDAYAEFLIYCVSIGNKIIYISRFGFTTTGAQ
jgi:hypothetical protein